MSKSQSEKVVRLELELNHTRPKQSKDDMDLPVGHWSIHFRWEQTWSKYDGNLRRIYAYNSALFVLVVQWQHLFTTIYYHK